MKLLVVNLHSSRNAGDDLLTTVTVQQLQQSFNNAEIILSMNDPSSYCGPETTVGSFMTWLRKQDDALSMRHLLVFLWILFETMVVALLYRLFGMSALKLAHPTHRTLLKHYFSTDLVVSAAGNFLYTSGRVGLPFMIAIYTMFFAFLAKKPLYTMPHTIGPLNRKWEQFLVKWIAKRTEITFVRDMISFDELKRLGVPPTRYRAVPDLAFAYPHCDPELGRKLLSAHGISESETAPLLGITMMNWGEQTPSFKNQSVYETAVVQAIKMFVEQYKGKVILFSQVRGPTYEEDDRVSARRVFKQVQDFKNDVAIIEKDVTTDELKSAYSFMDLFIGTRLHSNIFAISEGVPALMIEYRYKTRGVMEFLSLESWVIDIHEVQHNDISDKLELLWVNKEHVQKDIKTVMPKIIRSASQVGKEIAKNYEQRK